MKRTMSSNKCLCCFLLIGGMPFCLTMDALVQDNQAFDASVAELSEIKQAWAERRRRVKSLDLSAVIKQTTPGTGVEPKASLDPFRDPQPKDDLIATIQAEYYFDGDKYGMVRNIDKMLDLNDPRKLVPQTYRATFDGTANRTLIVQTDLPMGTIIFGQAASKDLLVNVDFMAVGLWLWPQEWFDKAGWSPSTMMLNQEIVRIDGVECRRIDIPHSKTRRMTSTLDVDPKRSWVPIQYSSWVDGKLSISLNIRYADKEGAVPAVQEWICTLNNQAAGVDSLREGQVKRCQINSKIEELRFAIEFPFGTQVSKLDGAKRSFFIQREDGLHPLNKADFGRRGPMESELSPGKKI